jgi:predicted transcriptional regulator
MSSTTNSNRAASRRRAAPTSRTTKVSLSIDSEVLRKAKALARKRGRNLSAHVSDALARDTSRSGLAALIAEYEAEAGVITEEEMNAARAKWLRG